VSGVPRGLCCYGGTGGLIDCDGGCVMGARGQAERRADAEQRKADADRLVAQLQGDLAKESALCASLEKSKAALERQVKELRDRLEDVELGASAGTQRTVMRLEARIEELQTRLQTETTARTTAAKEKRSAERELAEAQLRADEAAKEKAVLEEQARKYEARLKTLRTQLAQSVRAALSPLTCRLGAKG
jgi:chromosome segregation ATPase